MFLSAWRHIARVSESTFHRFQGYAAKGESAQPHGNAGSMKPCKHTLQATATLECALEKEADHMPHRTHTLFAWRHIARVSESTFHRFQGYAAKGESAQPHGNAGTMKPCKHTLQATATLECAL